MIVKKLNGHSGCNIELIKEKELFFVRKSSTKKSYNKRLEKQMLKQNLFSSSKIKTPIIYKTGYNKDNLYYYDMEYIKGVFFEYIENQNIASIKNKFKVILDFISESNEISDNISSDTINKLNRLDVSKKYDNYINYCLDFSWEKINKSYCHGDLTFENIMIYDDKVYFIDFLDSYTDCKLLDFSKIFQEIYAFWSFRDKNVKFNIKYVILDEMIVLSNLHREASIRMLIINLLRILPYSDKQTTRFVDYQLKYIREKL